MSTAPAPAPTDLIHIELDGRYVLPPALAGVVPPGTSIYGALLRDPFTGMVWSAGGKMWIVPAAWPMPPIVWINYLVPLVPPTPGDPLAGGLHEATFAAPGGPPGDVPLRIYLMPIGPAWTLAVTGKAPTGQLTLTGPSGTATVPIGATEAQLQAALDACYGAGNTSATIPAGVNQPAGGTLGPGNAATIRNVPPADGVTMPPPPTLDVSGITGGSAQVTVPFAGQALQRLPGGSGTARRSAGSGGIEGKYVMSLTAQRQ